MSGATAFSIIRTAQVTANSTASLRNCQIPSVLHGPGAMLVFHRKVPSLYLLTLKKIKLKRSAFYYRCLASMHRKLKSTGIDHLTGLYNASFCTQRNQDFENIFSSCKTFHVSLTCCSYGFEISSSVALKSAGFVQINPVILVHGAVPRLLLSSATRAPRLKAAKTRLLALAL